MSAKKLKIEYGDSVFALPREAVTQALSAAGAVELKVLLLAASDDDLRKNSETACAHICMQLDITESAFDRALDFWSRMGVISLGDAQPSPTESAPAAPPSKPVTLQSGSMPSYTESQAADVIEAHTELADIIAACQQIAEKLFTSNEIQSIVGMYDHLGLTDPGYIETLYLYCKSLGKTSPRYVEKVAISLHDSDVMTTLALNEYIRRREVCDDVCGKIRALVGVGDRALTAKEKKLFECWCTEWGFDIDVITRAYEVTVDNIGEYKPAYMNKVLENWHGEGLTTIEKVSESLDRYKKTKAEAARSDSDFDEDEYFEAALARSERYFEKNKTDG